MDMISPRLQYECGQNFPPHNHKFKKELPSIGNRRFGLFTCGYCDREFDCEIAFIKNGKRVSCGCRNKTLLPEYKSGQVFEPFNHVFVGLRSYKKGVKTCGLFLCGHCGGEFDCAVSEVARGKRKCCGCTKKRQPEPTEKACSKCKVVKPIACYQWQEKRQSHRAACIECNRDVHAKRGQKQKLPQSHYLDISIKNGINPLSDRKILGEMCKAEHRWNGLDYSLKDYNSRGQINECIECKRLRMAEYSQRPEVKQRMEEWQANHQDKGRLSRWLESPRISLPVHELIENQIARVIKERQRSKDWHRKNYCSQKQREFYNKNKEYELMRVRIYKHANPGKIKNGARRVKTAALQSDGTITKSFLKELYSKAKRCPYCFSEYKLEGMKCKTLDHIQPLSKGGKHSANNVLICCRDCNTRKNDKTAEEWFQFCNPSFTP